MRKVQKVVILAGILMLAGCLSAYVKAAHDLQSARREYAAVTEANDFLRKTLADMTRALSAKDREIDRLKDAACNGREKRPAPDRPAPPRRSRVSESGE